MRKDYTNPMEFSEAIAIFFFIIMMVLIAGFLYVFIAYLIELFSNFNFGIY